MKQTTLKISDLNEASYYMLFGAKMVSVKRHNVSTKEAKRKGFVDQWILTLTDVIPWVMDAWKSGISYGNITDYVNVRTKLKRKIKRELGISSS